MSHTTINTDQGRSTKPASAGHTKKSESQGSLDALTSAFSNSHIASELSIEPEAFKKLALQDPTSDATAEVGKQNGNQHTDEVAKKAPEQNDTLSQTAKSLGSILHDWTWSQGGEVILSLGRRTQINDESASSATPAKSLADAIPNSMTMGDKLEDVKHINMSLTSKELSTIIRHVKLAASQVDCQATTLFEHLDEKEREPFAFIMVRRIPSSAQELLELRVAVVGNVDAGKSSTLGVLTRGGLDDGRGKARVNLFRHKHEIESGRTSSVGMEILGFDVGGGVVMNIDAKNTSEPGRKMSWEEICEKSAKVVSFIDLAGHERYLKTTVGGLTGCLPDFVMLMVGANAGLIGMSKEHLGVALALAVPVLVCITKIDMTPPHILEATIKQLTKILRSPGCRKTPIFIESPEQTVDAALRLGHERICPIFQISNVTGHNLNLLRSFLNILPQANAAKFSPNAPFKFQLQDVFSVPFVGCVVSGVVLSGMVKVGDNLIIGPDTLGQFTSTSVRSIQRKRVNVEMATAGQSASFALKKIRRNQVRKGMVMMSKAVEGQPPPRAVMTCDAEILCLYHSTTLSVGSCMVLHAASIRQTVRITQIAKLDAQGNIVSSTWPNQANKAGQNTSDGSTEAGNASESVSKNGKQTGMNEPTSSSPDKPVVRTGDRALLRLQFIRTAEYLEPGLKLITREGKTKLIGVVRAAGQTGPLSADIIPKNRPAGSNESEANA
ncbi:P-loop containing nucleoside triphosphate hydrolase protein [Meira miltonrushii]|uniref:P-loop containing nucleoside triphosphate hydrolase protein n=1 Tax=Meira miltonrushii TaxID=1280837 RepID=A0A316VLA9_9BASI|nr:P-loop containing nucleoside triphosphate hydrolase protein [Meira miltonrushii]PWN37153.1 P-loop containing nucleoside triphosphate hydrolase protein [Meira miltonrushii]